MDFFRRGKKPNGPSLDGGTVAPPAVRASWGKRLALFAAGSLLAAAALIGLVSHNYHSYINSPERLSAARLMAIDPGMSFKQAASRLHREGVISNRTFFIMLARSRGVTTKIQAGEYTFKPGMNPLQILDLITQGDVTVWKLRAPEGVTVAELGRRLAELGPWSGERFVALATDEARAGRLGIPTASLEGYLFPATYNLRLSMTEDEVLDEMLARGLRERTAERLRRAEALDQSWHEVLTLASLLQKEAMKESEMPLIASVFVNRLKLKMKLQCDPTAIYDLADYTGPVTKDHLARESPYNTYVHEGLPPGPICNPGEAAIVAALNPSDSDYLYFVAKGDGWHAFSSNYLEHRQNISKYLKNE